MAKFQKYSLTLMVIVSVKVVNKIMRPTRDQWAMSLAIETAKRATCLRRSVGCVLLNERGHVLATGYNGVASGMPHCNQVTLRVRHLNPGESKSQFESMKYKNACPGAESPSGKNLDSCHAIHAEQNALLQCKNVHDIYSCYTTTSPCVTCIKLLMNTSCQVIYYLDDYSQSSAVELWKSMGRKIFKLTL